MKLIMKYKMPLKAVSAASVLAVTVIMSRPLSIQGDTSIAKSSKQLVEWYREIITQLTDN